LWTIKSKPITQGRFAKNLYISRPTFIIFIENAIKLGVGGATKRGFEEAIAIGAENYNQGHADDQNGPLGYSIRTLLDPLIANTVWCNQRHIDLRDHKSLKSLMPIVRRDGNLAYHSLIKSATGYWATTWFPPRILAIKQPCLVKSWI